jgi:hypothetical protein
VSYAERAAQAKAEGWRSFHERRTARAAGFTTPEAWAAHLEVSRTVTAGATESDSPKRQLSPDGARILARVLDRQAAASVAAGAPVKRSTVLHGRQPTFTATEPVPGIDPRAADPRTHGLARRGAKLLQRRRTPAWRHL